MSYESALKFNKFGFPDVFDAKTKRIVETCAQNVDSNISSFPTWLPKMKDGSYIFLVKATQVFFSAIPKDNSFQLPHPREVYYKSLTQDVDFITKISLHDISVLPVNNCLEFNEHPFLQDEILFASQHAMECQACFEYTENSICSSESQLSTHEIETISDCNFIIGSGSFADVYCNHSDVTQKLLYAFKVYRIGQDKVSLVEFLREGYLQKQLSFHDHCNIAKAHDVVKYLDRHIIVTAFAAKGSLFTLLYEKIDDELCLMHISNSKVKKNILLGILNGLMFMHHNNIVHCDLKPQNILMSSDYTPQITDFGASKFIDDLKSSYCIETPVQGTAGYMSPELVALEALPPSRHSDMYSFGVLMNELVSEEVPYYEHLPMFYKNGADPNSIIVGGLRPYIHPCTNAIISVLIQECWSLEPLARPLSGVAYSVIESVSDIGSILEYVLKQSVRV